MFIAIDKEGNRVLADNANKDKKYFCPICKTEVRLKKGNINATHFAHITLTNCDDFTHDMSEWHKEWQSLFPVRNREVIIKGESETHRADVLCYGTVIEFQHSPISEEEFWRRNEFYTGQGYKVVWIFDTIATYKSGQIDWIEDWEILSEKGGEFKWKRPWKFLRKFNPESEKDVTIFFQFELHNDAAIETDIPFIEKIIHVSCEAKPWKFYEKTRYRESIYYEETPWKYFRTSITQSNVEKLLEWLKDRWEKEKMKDSSL